MTAKSSGIALRILQAIGGSANGMIHPAAIAGRLGTPLGLEALNAAADSPPVLVDLKPIPDARRHALR